MDFNYLFRLFVDNYQTLGFGTIIIVAIRAVPKCYAHYCDLQKTINTNMTNLEIERLKAKQNKKSKNDPSSNLRIDRDSS